MADLSIATREYINRTLKHEVWWKMPIFEALEQRNKIIQSGGTDIRRPVVMDTIESLAQSYSANDVLNDEAKETLAQPIFTWKLMQLPLRYPATWEIQNAHADNDTQVVNLIKFLGEQGQDGIRRKMTAMMYNSGTTTPATDGGEPFQSLISALNHDTTYGTLSRSFSGGTRDWWQGSDPAGLNQTVTSSSQDASYNISVANLRKWIYETSVAHWMKDKNDILVVMCPTLFNKLRAEMESKMSYKPTGDTQRQGFNKMLLDGNITIADDPYLQKTSTTKTWLFILNLSDWDMYISTARNFKVTPFEWQGKQTNGVDVYLARILVAGNICCWKCNGSMWLSAVS